ncbi:hypothetical protein EHQ12_06065 [Leptospira gomenensis]|uniref:Uncharacterized protein n=1 Tax=Leptospira gomenensis TaxID=2484974 RepID=A0A5F1Y904_9LEPT|nr:hypothetical protein [Leptospira gomenensis]TGK30959.1 hypothetical protein EHQ17_14655 [Leptospira gomenensis]TGK41753.1 hypothetical protein EHQ12_06065 [Leptospira gomenensis]TGK45321.1 hypothetical protein EHQ07_10340 [Leptospira gomenensis]TGK66234.1 hypothetical protein EHQ13_04075 [Leptospira gomenensis]
MKLILFLLMTYLVYRVLSRFFSGSAERSTRPQWRTFYTRAEDFRETGSPREKDISARARVVDSASPGEK